MATALGISSLQQADIAEAVKVAAEAGVEEAPPARPEPRFPLRREPEAPPEEAVKRLEEFIPPTEAPPAAPPVEPAPAEKGKLPTTDEFFDAAEKEGFSVVEPSEEGAVKIGDAKYPTFVTEDKNVKIALTTTPIFVGHGNKVWNADPSERVPGEFVIGGIITEPGARGKGLASKALDQLLAAADKAGATLYGEPIPMKAFIGKGEKALTKEQLVKWYESKGFTEVEGSGGKIIVRSPEAPLAEAPAAAKVVKTYKLDPEKLAKEPKRAAAVLLGKKQLLTQIDEAILNAKTLPTGSAVEQVGEVVTFEIDGETARVWNTSSALTQFRENVQATAMTAGRLPAPAMRRPLVSEPERERIGELKAYEPWESWWQEQRATAVAGGEEPPEMVADVAPDAATPTDIENIVVENFRKWPEQIKEVGEDYWTTVMSVARELDIPYRYKALRRTLLGSFGYDPQKFWMYRRLPTAELYAR